ncbi:MAG TPA: peptidoglycan-binding protein [Intrasporangium sp.]|uniref:peptidoglycan-binding protein n=1 Tax=Intrasporangium sp. TaxID=1925024 RepID=UPI002D77E41B|nr:peptidoglycan-binding protein [Intrasporangium sp.]HET7399720.1 peptidoglycan-binding protein [Intrasporangium sp.]
MTLRRRIGMALAVPALGIPLTGQAAALAAIPAPPHPSRPLPVALDVAVPYQAQTICDPRARPGVVAFATLLTSYYRVGSVSLIGRTCSAGTSEHFDGRAWDWMLSADNPAQEAIAQSVLTWLTRPDAQGRPGAMARRFGLMYIIHNRKMWRAYAPERGWAPYSGSSPHTDHIHFSFTYDGAAGRTSWWTGVATTSYLTTLPAAAGTAAPPPAPARPVPAGFPAAVPLSFGMTSEAVRTLQAKLGSLPTTGYFGPLTQARVVAYQRFVGLPPTGVADVRTQQVLATRGWAAPPPPAPSVPPPAPAAPATLSYGMRSEAVRALQARLGGLPTTGYFGDLTKARVMAYQRFVGLPETGVADARTQQVLASRGWAAAPAPGTRPAPAQPPAAYTYPADPGRGFLYLECGDFVAWRLGLTWRSFGFPSGRGGAVDWKAYAGNIGRVATSTPSVGDIAWWARGHVALVTAVAPDGSVTIEEFNGPRYHAYSVRSGMRADSYLHKGPAPAAPAAPGADLRTPFTAYKGTTLTLGSRGGAVAVLQRALRVHVTAVFNAETRTAVRVFEQRAGLPRTGTVTRPVWDALERRDFPFLRYRATVLRVGATGEAVRGVQRVLGVTPTTGYFGPRTELAVRTAQVRAGLPGTGVVDARTWMLLDRLAR